MSQGLNMVVLIGNIGADPELRTSQSGTSVLSLSLATNEEFLDKNQQKQERTEWHRVKVFGARAEGLGRILSKGERIVIRGRVSTSSYEKDGQKKYSTEIIASEVYLTGRGAPARTNGVVPSYRPPADLAPTDLPF